MSRQCETARKMLGTRPKVSLGFFPTPCYKLENLSKDLGVNLYIKRDDFTGMSLFGGNKVRKLEYLIGEALEQGCEYVFTYGVTQSNHAMQTAWACRQCGLKPILYLVAVVQPDQEDVRSNLLLDRILDAEIHLVEIQDGETEEAAENRSVVMAQEHRKRLEAEGHKCYDVPMGGASSVGSIGFIEGYVELEEQLLAAGLSMDYIVHATGTGGTMAGLAAGRKLTGSNTTIISINASSKPESYRKQKAELASESLSLIGSELQIEAEDLNTDLNYYGQGYEIPTKEASEAIKLLAVTEGLFLDPVYTGKAFAGLLDYIRTGKIAAGSNVVFWHTGGATALFAEKAILGDIGC